MKDERMLDRNVSPTLECIQEMLGREVYPVWEEINHFMRDHYSDCESEWRFYNPQRGWGLRFRIGSQQLCMLFPERGGLSALVALTPEQDESALGKIEFFNNRIRDLLNQPSSLPQGRWLWMRIEDHTDFVGFKLLMDIKTTS